MTVSVLISFFLRGILFPAVVAGLSYLFTKDKLKFSTSISLAVGFLAGFLGISGLSSFRLPPVTVQHWLPYITVAALALGIAEQLWLKNIFARWAVRLVLLVLLLVRLFQPFINHPFPNRSWSTGQTFTNLLITTLVISTFWLALDLLSRKERTASRENAIPITGLVAIVAASAIAVVLAHSLVMAQLTGAIAASLGAIMVLAWLTKTTGLNASITPLITLLLTLPWLSIYTTIPVISVILIALAPWLLLIDFKTKPLLQQSIYRIGLSLVAVIVIIVTTMQVV